MISRTSAERYAKAKEIFFAAVELDAQERAELVRRECGDDAALLGEVESLLTSRDEARDFLEPPALENFSGYEAFKDKVIGGYRLVRELGVGGMGVVFLAEKDNAEFSRRVALKIVKSNLRGKAIYRRFNLERQILSRLEHPNIARLIDGGTTADGLPYFVMEYVEGAPLIEYVKAKNLLLAGRLELFRQVCAAVSFAHKHAVIHRDLKPSNILVTSDGTAKLLDFGIAKLLASDTLPQPDTATTFWAMTPEYASPEQIMGETVTTATDVYSLGVILYELLVGQPPFDLSGHTPGEVERMIMETEPEKPSCVAKRVAAPSAPTRAPRAGSWADLDVLCLTAMHKNRERRYESVEALMRDIDHYLNSEPLEARPDALGYKLGKFVRRNRRAVAAAAAVLTIVVGLVVFFTLRLATARDEALAAAARTQRIQRFMVNLFEGGDSNAGPSEDLRVVTLIERGVREAQSLNHEPEVQAELFHTLGTSYHNLGVLDQADSLLRTALDRRQALLGADHPQVAESLVALGILRVDQARLDEAEQLVREGLEKIRRTRSPDNNALANATTALGNVLTARGEYDKAIQVLDEAVRLHPASAPPTPELLASLGELANAHFYAGHYDVSEMLNKRALSIDRELYGERHIYVANGLVNLAAIRFQRGRYEEAEQLYHQALDITRDWYREDNPAVASKLTLLAQALTSQGRYDEAEKLLQQALDINERVYPKVHPRVALALNESGTVALRRGKLDDAEARYRRASDIFKAVYGDHHSRTVTALSNLANVYVERKEYNRAEQMYRDVVERYTKISPDHLNTGIARIKLGRTLVRQRRYQEAEADLLAGYEILMKQTDPSVRSLRAARENLVTLYDALKQPEKAERFRSELAKARSEVPAVANNK